MGFPDLIALAAVGAGLFFAVRGARRGKGGCSGCGGDCARCGGCASCRRR
jgi:hypothetical protein